MILYVHEYIIFKLSNFSVNSKVIFGGLSLGEITALSSTRIFYFISTIYIVKVRSFTMNYLCNSYAGSMSAISNYRSICEVYILVTKFKSNISNINSNKQIVISGDSLNINHLKGLLIRNNINVYDIKVHGSFHSESMINAGLIMYYFMKRFKLKSPTSKILSNLTGFFYKNKNFCFYISKQIFKPVNFLMNTLCVIHQKPLFIFELGCGKIISNLLRRNFSSPTFKVFQISTMHDYLNKNL
ncbi:hypothetical protein E5P55_01135 [Candidatus Pinguicoccus supinus]|uniref:[acyl-carrier-protein] S-malonyltransferase n=1 Tax=Candidatus Pinguicoccus supinus TaxID=2529394 RepID=A0A7T0BRN2_9BACT|nr:hypothetical protein E5P55_01135 [Candidatus Pinguicoccus supinus]